MLPVTAAVFSFFGMPWGGKDIFNIFLVSTRVSPLYRVGSKGREPVLCGIVDVWEVRGGGGGGKRRGVACPHPVPDPNFELVTHF